MLRLPNTCMMEYHKRFVQRESYADEGIANGVSYDVPTVFVYEIFCEYFGREMFLQVHRFHSKCEIKIFAPFTSSPTKCIAHSYL
jgi:hypothetical protein